MYKLENNVEWTEELKNAFKHGITKGKIRYIDDNNNEVIIDYNNGLKKFKLYDEKNVPNQGFIGQSTARQVDLELLNIVNINNLENKEFELFLGADYKKLPSEYQEVEYIESTGTQYIDTRYTPNQDTRTVAKVNFQTLSQNKTIFGTRINANVQHYGLTCGGGDAGNVLYSGYNTDSLNTDYTVETDVDYIIDKDKNNVYLNNNLIAEQEYNNFGTSYNMYIFAMNERNELTFPSNIRIYYCKIYENDILIRNLIPCYRKSDNIIGMYDLVNGVFYTNQGTGTFLKGNDVPILYYINYGKFIVNQAPENDVTNGTIKITALDYMIKFNPVYVPNVIFPCTLKDILDDLCEQSEVELGTTTFSNMNFIVEDNQFEGKTRREVLRHIAKCAFSWARIGQDNKLYLDFEVKNIINEEIGINDYYQDKFKKANEYYGPINRVVYAESNIEGQEEKVEDTDSIALNGLHEFVIYDNYFAYTTEKRQELIQAGTRLFGLKYMPIQELSMVGLAYLDCTDVIEVTDPDENIFNTITLNHIIEYDGAVSDNITSETNSSNEEIYKNTNSPMNANSITEVIVDRALKQIKLIIQNVVDLLQTKNGMNQIFIDNIPTGTSYINKFIIKGNTNYFITNDITIVASKNSKNEEVVLITEDGDTLFTEDEDTILLETKSLYIDSKNIILSDVLRDLTINGVTYYDELQILQDGTIQIIKRIGVSSGGILYLLDKEEITILEDTFLLPSDRNGLYYFIEELNNLDYYVEYIVENEYSNTFATMIQLQSEIKILENLISLSVSELSTNLNAKIELKVNLTDLISEINASADIIRLIGQRLIIQMQNYELNENGYMKALLGEIAGFNFESTKFSKSYNTLYDFTSQDVQLLMGYLNSYNSLASSVQNLYELNGDNNLNIVDVVRMINIINGSVTNTKTSSGIVSINSNNSNSILELTNNLGVNKTRVGIFSIYAYLLSADIVSLTDASSSDINGIVLDKGKRQITVKSGNNETIILPNKIESPVITQTSLEVQKKNFEKLENALEEVQKTDIYKYNFKTEKNIDKKHVGFVIGPTFNYSHLITAVDDSGKEVGVEDYSMVSVLWQAFKEYVEKTDKRIEKLENEIKYLKGEK